MKTRRSHRSCSVALAVILGGQLAVTSACGDPDPDDQPDAQVLPDVQVQTDAADVTCRAGDPPRCNGTTLEVCGAGDTWVAERECGDAGCNATARRCNDCNPSVTSSCLDGAVIECSTEGLLLSEQPCDHGCRLAGAVAECTACSAGATECVGDVWTTCDALGQPAAEQPCEYGCSDILQGCQECVAGDLACQGDDLVACGVLGLDEERLTCAHGCSAEALVCQCEASTATCEGDVLHRCGADALPAGSEICALGCNADRGACNECIPGVDFCDGDAFGTCSTEGLVISLDDCPLGCNAWVLPQRCFTFQPTYATEADLHDASVTWPTASTITINTNTGMCVLTAGAVTLQGEVRPQDDPAPDLCVFRFADIDIPYTQSVRVTGSNGLVLVSAASIYVAGLFDGAAHGATAGPGGRSSSSSGIGSGDGGNGASFNSDQFQTGGGGGGHAGTGGTGGGSGGTGGAVMGNTTLDPLLAGSRGGFNAKSAQAASVGAGGGVIVLVAWAQVEIATSQLPLPVGEVVGAVDVSGGAGQDYGVGGGSGGSVFIEAPQVTVNGVIRGKGGGGACSNAAGTDGRNGGAGCTSADPNVSRGGIGGGYWTTSPFVLLWLNGGNGLSVNFAFLNKGGGGGAAGRLLINAFTGVTVAPQDSLFLTYAFGYLEPQ